jgi:hypothetical protein
LRINCLFFYMIESLCLNICQVFPVHVNAK